MPRQGRRVSETGCYHIIIRGNNKQVLFPAQVDFDRFTEFLGSYLEKYPIKIHHYCLMHNHVHLLLWSPGVGELSRYMHGVQRSYHHYYRKAYTLFGHLTQGRYRSFAIEDDGYLLECGRYIEKNPVRAGMTARAEGWPYSSYCFYAYGKQTSWLEYSPAYLGLASDAASRQTIYRQHAEMTRPDEELLHKRLQKI